MTVPAAATLVVVLASNSEGTDPIGEWDGAGDAAHDGFFRYDDSLTGEVWQAFRLRNDGDQGLAIDLFETWTDGGLDWDLDSCGAAIDLAPEESCEIRSTYDAASSLEGFMQAEIVVHSDDEERPELSLVVSAEKPDEGGCSTLPAAPWLAWLTFLGLRRRFVTQV